MTFPKQETSFLKIYKDLDTLVPFQILKLALIWAIFTGIQELFQKGFDCPCIHTSNVTYGVMFFILPGVTFILVSLLLLKFKICSWPGCKRLWQLVPRVVFPGLMWVTVVLLDGDAVACIETSSESQNLSDILCKFKTNKPLSTEQEQIVRRKLFASQIAGLVLLLVMPFLAILIQLCKCCKRCETCFCWIDDLEQDYREKAQQHIEDLSFSIPLKKQKEEVTQKIEQALNNSRKTYWTVINDLCNDIKLQTDDDVNPQPTTSDGPPAAQNVHETTGSWKDLFTCASCSCCCKAKRTPRRDQSQRSRQQYGQL